MESLRDKGFWRAGMVAESSRFPNPGPGDSFSKVPEVHLSTCGFCTLKLYSRTFKV